MKRPRSYSDDLDGDGNDWGRRDPEVTKMRSLKGLDGESSRPSYRKSYNGRIYDKSMEEGRDGGRMSRKRIEHETDGFERSRESYSSRASSRRERGDSREGLRKGFDRAEVSRSSRESGYRDGGGDSAKGSPRRLHSAERVRRSSSFSAGCASKRESYEPPKFVQKGFRSERERCKREEVPKFHLVGEAERSYGSEGPCGSSQWKRSSSRDVDEDHHHAQSRSGRGIDVSVEDRPNGSSGNSLTRSPQGSKDADESCKGVEMRKVEEVGSQSSSSEMEEGELEPEPGPDPPKEPEPEAASKPQPEPEEEGLSKAKREEEGNAVIAEVEKEVEKEVEEKLDDSDCCNGETSRRDVEMEEDNGDAEKEDPENFEGLKSSVDLEKPDDSESMKEIQITHGAELAEAGSVSGEKDKTNDEAVNDLNNQETGQQPTADWGIEQRKGIDLEAESKMETLEAPKETEMVEEKCQELTLSFMCAAPKAVVGSSANVEAGAEGKFLWNSTDKLKPEEGGEMGKDKGKRLALSLSNDIGIADYGGYAEKSLPLSKDKKKQVSEEEEHGCIRMVGTSSRGFARDPLAGSAAGIEKMPLSSENQRQKKPKLEPLQLSLGLPDVSLTLASPNPNLAPASPSRGRSIQSLANTAHTRTSSDGFTASISFSGSHPFVHNPSCSLTQNSMENYEYSVGSHPVFQGSHDQVSHGNWPVPYASEQASYGNNGLTGGISQDRFKQRREVPLYQRILQNGNLQAPQTSQGIFGGSSRGQPSNDRDSFGYERGANNNNFQGSFPMAQGHQVRSFDGSLGRSNRPERQGSFPMVQGRQVRSSDGSLGRNSGPERQPSFPRDLPQQWKEVRSSPTKSAGSRETKSEQRKQIDRDRTKSEGDRAILAQRGNHGRGVEQPVSGAPISPERTLVEIVSGPIPIMSQKLQEMPENSLDRLRECVRDLIGNNEKSEDFATFQKILQRRSDLTSEVLSQSHRVQLEILVAIKTGIQAFLRRSNNLPTSDLVEVFFNLRCRNLACRSALPVDDCECKFCSQRSGFCNACMCLVCSKFDFASNTCSWVGCDLCLHWCHTDCGIRMSHIKNGRSIRGAPGTTEMQFYCIACEHFSEMFGFVKEVFRTCAKDWDAETLAKELECVRRIFQGSEDPRGKQLRSRAEQMLVKLESKADPTEVCNSIMMFFTETESNLTGTSSFVAKEPVQVNQRDACERIPVAVREAVYNMTPGSSEKVGNSDKVRSVLQNYDREVEGKRTEAAELQFSRARNKAEIDELESIVRIKQAEAKMFQVRADDARREAEGLQRIALAKNEKIEEEYACKLAKLCLNETEERRKHKFEELQILERAQRDYYNMKMRMEADIKDLLMKMEATKRRF
eukprot:Gb_35127 [translate_table: standard]